MTSKEALKNIKTLSYCKQHITIQEWCNIIEQDLDRLEELKDLEEEIGIDLITLFKALKNGIWIKKKGKIKNLLFFYENVNLYEDYLYICPVDIYDERVCINQYGKTWALTREELENE